MFSGLLQKTCLNVGEVRRKSFSNKFSRLLHKVCLLLSSLVLLRKLTLSELNYATGRERKEDGKPCVTSVTIILFEATFRQTSHSLKRNFFVKTSKR